ncbi:hypothetical protein K402DRAFT_450128 [Aulographum hederae CBS 113979]|uniref:Uncharacterized protein n=1 Tax=Aulographum hederae CBS 113979 TaxID=1176131 RepID=A0A6G1HFY4_9PEZI|nr:hypothetical protein K402DRAFT_450128 [Aulographum hederae CBS 113979]
MSTTTKQNMAKRKAEDAFGLMPRDDQSQEQGFSQSSQIIDLGSESETESETDGIIQMDPSVWPCSQETRSDGETINASLPIKHKSNPYLKINPQTQDPSPDQVRIVTPRPSKPTTQDLFETQTTPVEEVLAKVKMPKPHKRAEYDKSIPVNVGTRNTRNGNWAQYRAIVTGNVILLTYLSLPDGITGLRCCHVPPNGTATFSSSSSFLTFSGPLT